MSLLRLLQFRLEACGEVGWWFRPPWNKDKDRPSVLDAERLMRRHRAKIQRLLSKWAGDEGKTEEAAAWAGCKRVLSGHREVLPQTVQQRETLGGEAGPPKRPG